MGTPEGGRKAAETNKRNDPDFYKKIGHLGGSISVGGFGSETVGRDGLTGKERARVAGKIGGEASKRGPSNSILDIPTFQRKQAATHAGAMAANWFEIPPYHDDKDFETLTIESLKRPNRFYTLRKELTWLQRGKLALGICPFDGGRLFDYYRTGRTVKCPRCPREFMQNKRDEV